MARQGAPSVRLPATLALSRPMVAGARPRQFALRRQERDPWPHGPQRRCHRYLAAPGSCSSSRRSWSCCSWAAPD
ncbi:hypothetical protein ACFPM0_32235 [Pseudonocardia sulfidoxydans]|uniref:hypothetical protein n=1 Tax=Pseudonocardia sulfidoxydans TaxID=54011 RepID=UPI0036227494